MGLPLQLIVAWAHRRRALVLILTAVVAALSLLGLQRLTFDADVLRLLPQTGRAVPAFRLYVQRFAPADQLQVLFTAPEGHRIEEYGVAIDAWVKRLERIEGISSVDSGSGDGRRDWSWLAGRELLLLDPQRLDEALRRLQPAETRASLNAARELLVMPSPTVEAMVQNDPLNLTTLLRDRLGPSSGAAALTPGHRGYMSQDGRQRLVLARPARGPYDTSFSRRLMARLDSLRADATAEGAGTVSPDTDEDDRLPPMQIEFAGGHRIATETEAVVRRESILNSVVSLALILPLLFVAFRSVWLVLVGALPAGISLLVVFGLMGLGGATLFSAAAGSAAMLFGLGVDGVVLLYVTHRVALAAGQDGDGAIASTAGPSASMLLGMFTTAATFYGLCFVDFPSLQQLGLIIGHSMVACGVFTLILVPALLPSRAPRGGARGVGWPRLAPWIRRRRRTILLLAATLTVVLGVAALSLHVNPTLDRLRPTTPGAELERRITKDFALSSDATVLLQQGDDLERLLAHNIEIVDRVHRAFPGMPLQAPSGMLPSRAAQETAAARVRREQLDPAAVARSIREASVSAGFLPGTLDPFLSRLPELLSTAELVTYEQYVAHGFGDLIGRMISRVGDRWTLATHLFPSSPTEVTGLQTLISSTPGLQVTSLRLVNEELAERFAPQFAKGLLIGTAVVLLMIVVTFRDWRLSLFSLIPTVLGLIWTAGLLAVARVELDLFAVFAVVTFVGIGVDYGIHMVHRYREQGGSDSAISDLAPVIAVAGAITLLGYGSLMTSTYPPLRSMGLVSVVSVIALASASILVLPALLIRKLA